jgi:murein DD-endopeptidase MepM/ murein hydrolase activator NlpD
MPDKKGATGPKWYDANGRSTVRTLMRTPIDGARISSPFGMREHPVLGFMKLHRGTDFAAPTGTPIFASGDAVVEFAGLKGPNGNFVKLRHDNGWETLYLHMNRILPGIIAGARVVQGRQIGEVGTTGRSTGPHLHYEVHIDGQPTDPLALQMGKSSEALTGAALKAFDALRDRVDARRSTAN